MNAQDPADRSAANVFSFALALILLVQAQLPSAAAFQESAPPTQGLFLVASRQIQDPRFQQSVILLLSVEHTGAAGLIINKPSGAKLSSLFRDMRKPGKKQDKVYYGGPVEPRTLLVLLRTKRSARNARPVLKNVFVSSNREVIKQTLRKKRAGDDYRIFMGYAGWTVGQLEREIQRGDWHVIEADAATVFHEDDTKLWPALIRKGEEIIVQEQDHYHYPARLLTENRFVLRTTD